MSKAIEKTVSFTLCTAIFMSLFSLCFISNAAYENTWVNTGNQRLDIIEIAKTQEGNTNGSKYGSGNWCAHFVSWCARQAGIPESVLKSSSRAGHAPSFFDIRYYGGGNQNAAWSDTDQTFGKWGGNNYTPDSGDLFFTTTWSHVGLVASVDRTNRKFTTIEGNSGGGKVTSHTYNIADYYFGVPDYEDHSTPPLDPSNTTQAYTDYSIYPAHSTVTVKWNAVTNATSYRVDGYCRYDNGSNVQFIDENVGNQTFKDLTLHDAGYYSIYVYAYDNSGNHSVSNCQFTVRSLSSEPSQVASCTLDGHTYTAYISTKTWHEARSWCESQGGHLATIVESSEWNATNRLVDDFSEPHFYIGGYKENGAWKWVTDETFSYTCWGEGQPDYDNENKIALWNHSGHWNNVISSESTVYGFILEKDPSAFSTKEQTTKPSVATTAYILNEGEVSVSDDTTLGTAPSDNISANRISGLKFSLTNYSGSIHYSAHVSNVGWQSEKKDGELAGVSNYSEGIEAIKISLSGDIASRYSVYYHTFVFGKGWNPWAKDGEISGTIGGGFPITAIRVMLVPKATYCVHVAEQGWTANEQQGATAGTTGQDLPLEAIAIDLCGHSYGDVKYKTHMAYIGWGHSRYNGGYSGSTGLALRAEAFQAELLGTAASKYDILYRAHVSDIGWLDWQRNGATAGTTGEDRQMEAIQVMVVPKNYQITDTPTYKTYDESIKRTIYFRFITDFRASRNAEGKDNG